MGYSLMLADLIFSNHEKNCRLRDSSYNPYHIQLCHCVNFLGHTANFSGVCILLINSLGCSAAHLSLECVKS